MNDEYLVAALAKIPDRRILVHVASQRCRELTRSSAPMVPVHPGEAHVDIALREIADGKLYYEEAS